MKDEKEDLVNTYHATSHFLNPLQTLENQWHSDFF